MELQQQSTTATKLLQAVIAKSYVELILVCMVATLAAFTTFSPQLRGAIDLADQSQIAGWVHDPQLPDKPIQVQLFIDGRFVAEMLADQRRDDLVQAGATTMPNHGFSFQLGQIAQLALTAGEHSAQVYAVRDGSAGNKVMLPVSRGQVVFRVVGD